MSKDKIKEEQEASGGRQDEGAGEEKIEQEMSQESIFHNYYLSLEF